MGNNKKKTPRRSPKFSSKSRFPLGELSRQRANLRDEYLSKSKELCALKKKIKRLQEKSEKVQECMNQLELTPVQPRSNAFKISKHTSTRRKKDPSKLSDDGKLKLPRRSAQRRQLETLMAATQINGGTVENRAPALEAIKLRDCASRFSMYHITPTVVQELQEISHDYFTAVVLYTGNVSGTVWSIGHLAPVHTQWMFDRHGTGLGVNTMQGREAKHVQIASYAKNSLFKERWPQVFRHDYISKLWLPIHQPSLLTYHQAKDSLIPSRVTKDPQHHCYCGFSKAECNEKCYYCGHPFMAEVTRSVKEGKPTEVCLKYQS